jgi:hypothetical protein
MPAFTVARKSRKAWPGATVSPKWALISQQILVALAERRARDFCAPVTDPISQIAA